MKKFDKKFGLEYIRTLPKAPGVYLIYNSGDELIYVGKAKNLYRRLSQYRNAKRRKAHWKMRTIVEEADKIEYQVCPDEGKALLRENILIQTYRPKWNTAGAFHFLYPMIGIKFEPSWVVLCYTTTPEKFQGFQFHGAYRSRARTLEAYESICEMLSLLGYGLPRNLLPHRPNRWSKTAGFRGLPQAWFLDLELYLKGQSNQAMESLVLALLESTKARRNRKKIQRGLDPLKRFWRFECVPLNRVLLDTGSTTYPVAQGERDRLFISAKHP